MNELMQTIGWLLALVFLGFVSWGFKNQTEFEFWMSVIGWTFGGITIAAIIAVLLGASE